MKKSFCRRPSIYSANAKRNAAARRAALELLRVENELTGARAERLVRGAVLNQLIGQAPKTLLRVALTPSKPHPPMP